LHRHESIPVSPTVPDVTPALTAASKRSLQQQIDSTQLKIDLEIGISKAMGVSDPHSVAANEQLTLDRLKKRVRRSNINACSDLYAFACSNDSQHLDEGRI
jgi:hypothetical protein